VDGRPEEIDAAQETKEERRIAQRRQGAADIGHQEDEEDEHVRVVAALPIRIDHGPDQQHRGAGGAHPAREQRADAEHRHVRRRRAGEIAGDADAAGDDEQCRQQDDERHVVQQGDVQQLLHRGTRTKGQPHRNDDRDAPRRRDRAVVAEPESRREDREKRDRQQQAGERKAPGEAKRRAVERRLRGLCDAREKGSEGQDWRKDAHADGFTRDGGRRTRRGVAACARPDRE
jgi:hypothetical protein